MRVVVWGINYAPEQTGIGPYNASLCRFLAQRGHQVEMVTTFQYYPEWVKQEADRGKWYRNDQADGVTIHRCWHFVPKKVRAWKRIVHELSFVVHSLARVLVLKRPDVFVVVSPPLLLGLAGAFVGFIKRAPFVFHVQDLQPDAAIRLGMLKPNRGLTRVLYHIEALAYAYASRVSSISSGILRMMRDKGVPESKLLFFPNGVRLPETIPRKGLFRELHGISTNTFIVLYSGNLGVKQGLSGLIDAARFVHERASGPRRIQFVIAGAGAMRDEIQALIHREALGNMLLLPLQSDQAYQEMLIDADCCAITQQPGTGALFFPSKLLTTLAFAKPVLSIADEDSDLAHAVAEGAFGVNVPPGSTEAVVAALDRWSAGQTDLTTLGERGVRYVARYEMNGVLGRFESELRLFVSSGDIGEAMGSIPSPRAAASKDGMASSRD